MLAGLLAACSGGSGVDAGAESTTTTAPTAPAAAASATTPSPPSDGSTPAENAGAGRDPAVSAEPAPKATLSISVRDAQGGRVPGVPVTIDGPEHVAAVSNANGYVHAELPAGSYSIAVVKGCAGNVQVLDGESAKADLLGGEHLDGSLWVEWNHRFAPETTNHPADWTRADGASESYTLPTWTPDTAYVVSFTVIDRCGGGVAPGASVASWQHVASPNVTITDPGSRTSDGSGIARFTAQCSGGGVISIRMKTEREGDDVDLLAHSRRGGGRPTCGRS